MKSLTLLLIVFLVGGTPIAQRKQVQKKVSLPVKEINIPVDQRKVTDSMERDFLNAAKESDRKTLLLIAEKLKADKDNIFLRKENARLKEELKKIDTIYITKPNFFKGLFHRHKKTRS